MSAVVLQLIASALFSGMFALVKSLGPGFPNSEAAFFRALFGLPAVCWMLRRGHETLRPRRPWLMAARGLLGAGAMLGFFYALPRAKLADVTLINRTQPVLITLLARLVIKEPAPRLALISLGLGFGGALLVIKPGFGLLNVPGLVALGAVVFSALAHLAVRRLNASDTPLLIVFWFTLIVGGVSGLLGVPVFVLPNARQWLVLAVMGQAAAGGQLLMTTAYGRDTAPVVAAASYASVVYALVLGLAFWGELPDRLALVGGLLIVIAGLVLAWGRRGVLNPPAPL